LVLAGGFALYRNITHKPEAASFVPLVRTLTVGQTSADAQNVYPGESRAAMKAISPFRSQAKSTAVLSTSVTM
ncbi:hypothetical protein, partial [Phascolarctobacterium succinatutens]|uniref:hypothetical protein n=1 Tax=Phascolarctobacterium succinatutens TaxID=626940 RepID=UPI0026EF412B